MPHYKYVIVGGGMTGDAAVRGILEIDPAASIGMIGEEPYAPYNRPPLSKALWKGKALDTIWRGTKADKVGMHLSRKAQAIYPGEKMVVDDHETTYTYDRLLLATGGSPRRLAFGSEHFIYYRTLDDYNRLRKLAAEGERFAVIGGGFIGAEIAAALAMNGKEVVLIFPESGISARAFPSDLSRFLNDYYRGKAIEVLNEHTVTGMEVRRGRYVLKVRNVQSPSKLDVSVDGVVAGLGIQPNTELALLAGLDVRSGILVDERLQTSAPDVYAAGDVAEFHSKLLDRNMRVEHEDNANTMGVIAGRNMAGARQPYDHQPYFYSDLFDLGYEAIGELDPRGEVVADWREPYRKGVVYYMQGGRVRGVLMWNAWGQVDAARRLMAEPGPLRAADLKGRLPA
jgi:NADPH-dependent 2,4-dienoyl-CoA reductase/sulfur reductase-like enzyme